MHQRPSVPREEHSRPTEPHLRPPTAPSVFDPTLEHAPEQVVVFWRSPAYCSQWSPSSFVVDDVSYSFTLQYMMAEKHVFSKTSARWNSLLFC